MLINNELVVGAPLDKVWTYLLDVPNLAPCLPGAELVGDDGNGTYDGKVVARLGPVKLSFSGQVKIIETDEANHRMVMHAAGAEDKGKGTADMMMTVVLVPAGSAGTTMKVGQDLTISGAAAQFGRGMIADVTGVLMQTFAECLQYNITNQGVGGTMTAVRAAKPASGFAIGVRAARMALLRVFARFFLPYDRNR
ncbi:SRPBCC family protein [Pseudonocardia sp. GCM10023141]|uniref:SRPBCC family protein n=1 Tax=Pseudonocardia sp. GCM10023141 TaxID=3252653 RepID=UPI0036168AB5